MKKFFLLPLTAIVLSACSASQPAPVVSAKDSRELPKGTMQPVSYEGGYESGWQSAGVQPMPTMPTAMSTTTPTAMTSAEMPTVSATTPTVSVSPPVVNPVMSDPPKPTTTTKVVTKTKTVAKKVDQNFDIPRDQNNAPVYSQIKKGFYDGSTYTVRKGDTIFLIAYIVGKDVREIAELNNMSEPYQLSVGQKLKTGKSATETITVKEKVTVKVEPEITQQAGANGTIYSSDGTISGPIKAKTSDEMPVNNGIKASVGNANTPMVTATTASTGIVATAATAGQIKANTPNYTNSAANAPHSSIKWQWPTKGRVTQGFSYSEGGNKGLDIVGQKGQEVRAAAAGKVVHANNALEGYGNLIIIKHNDDFMSAYAHNDRLKVKEQDNVKAGQVIATLGSTGTNTNKLHFEIRYKGKAIDPTNYLPKQ